MPQLQIGHPGNFDSVRQIPLCLRGARTSSVKQEARQAIVEAAPSWQIRSVQTTSLAYSLEMRNYNLDRSLKTGTTGESLEI